jgi:hypothetical protein
MWYLGGARNRSKGDAVEYVMAFGSRAPAVLDESITADDVADDCRVAALSFLSGVAIGWDKVDLVLWLSGPYARATRHAVRGERVASMATEGDIDDATIEELVTRVRQQLIGSLESAALQGGALDFADDAIERRLVRRAKTAQGEPVWIPVDGSRMRLRDRLRGVLAADYLNRPEAYRDLYVCHFCENVVFDAGARAAGSCNAHKRHSGVVPRGDEDDIPARAQGD